MGTRSLLHIKDEGKTLVTLYRQYDGYPTGMGKDIKDALAKGKARLTNGYSGSDKNPEVFNGMGCLAAYLVGELKRPHDMGKGNSIGNVYVYHPDASDCGEKYTYTLDTAKSTGAGFDRKPGQIMLKIESYHGVIFDGPLSNFDPEAVKKAERDAEETEE